MFSTPRGRRATRRGLLGALLAVLAVVSAILLVTAAEARADGPAPTAVAPQDAAAGLEPVRDLASSASDRAAAVTRLLSAAATPPPPPPVFCPVPGSHFVDSWGFARSGGRRHQGVDMMASYGAPVFAPVAGEIRASHSALGGIGFYLTDAAGNVYFGSHLASLDATGPVDAGQQIGTVGTSGNAGSAHLHFEVEPAGRGSVNPYPFALDWCTTDFSEPGAVPLLP